MLSIRDIPLRRHDEMANTSASYVALCVVDDIAFELAALGLGPETLQRVKTLVQEVVEVVIDRVRDQHDEVLADAEAEAKSALESLREDVNEDHKAELDGLQIEHTQAMRTVADQITELATRVRESTQPARGPVPKARPVFVSPASPSLTPK